MSLVFLCYSHNDSEVADSICDALTECGVEHFRDVKDIPWGGSIPSEVRDALERSVAVLVILSRASLESQWVPYEIGFAAALRKRILPFLAEPSLTLPLYVSDLNHVRSLDQVRQFFGEGGLLEAVIMSGPGVPPPPESDFRKLIGFMPDLLAEMKADLAAEPLVREFIILPNSRVVFWHTKKRFTYFEERHEDLANKVDLLEQHGFVLDVTPRDTPIYRMTEEFVNWLEHE